MAPEEEHSAPFPGFCRDCLEQAGPGERCRACASPRLVRHDEIDELAIAHIDCDAFYASVEKRDNPALADRPVIVGGGRRGVVSTACYIARMSGVHSAMPMFQALKACPDAVVVRPDMAKYARVGREVLQLMGELTPLVEPLSIDEAFLDLTGTRLVHGASPARCLARFAMRIEREIGITVSVGLSHNKFLAKIASDLDKPRGFRVIGRAETETFLADRPVGTIWGVGKATQQRLEADGVRRIADLRRIGGAQLTARYGSIGTRLAALAFGRDERVVEPEREAKSISAETTFDSDVADPAQLERRLWSLCEKVAARAKATGLAGHTAVLKLKTGTFRTLTRSHRLRAPSQLADTLFKALAPLLIREATGLPYRLIGAGLSDLSPATPEPASSEPASDLFDAEDARGARIEAAMDEVRARFGTTSVEKGRGFSPAAPRPRNRKHPGTQDP